MSAYPRMANAYNVIIRQLWLESHVGRERTKLFQDAFHIGLFFNTNLS